MRKMLLSMFAVAVVLGFAAVSSAQQMKPVATVSFCGYDELMNNIGMFGRLGDNPNVGQGLEFMLQMMTQGKGLAGLDKAKPWAGVLLADELGNTAFYAYLPVTELKQLGDTIQALQPERIKLDGDVYEIGAGPTPLFAKQKGNWAVIGQAKETLDKAPADPLKLLGDMPKNYDLAVRLSVKNTPKQFREQFLAQVKAGIELGNARQPDETDEQYEFRIGAAEQGFQQLAAAVNELEDVMLGWNVDPSADTTYIDFEATAQSGTKLADQFATMKPGKSKFAGFLMPKAALSANWVGTMSDADVARAKNNLTAFHKTMIANLEDQGLSKEETKLATKLLNDIRDFLLKTVETKKSDGGLAVLLDPESATLVAGAAVADGGKLEKVVEQLIADVKNSDPDAAEKIQFNADNHQGIRFHKLSIPTPDPAMTPFVGDELEVVLGISDERVYLAAGRDAAGKLKMVIDQSKAAEDKDVPPAKISISAAAFAKFLAAAGNGNSDSRIGMLSAALAAAGDKDHVLITATPIERGVRLRLELEEGLLKALATAGSRMSPMGGMPPREIPPGEMPPDVMPPGGPVPPQ